ncbi:MAG TPA: endolytic transglycosylase MltG [Methylophilaceae bacterium]|nr:endolytic transglycosylase MltG [Methylophilaceae bacterium]
MKLIKRIIGLGFCACLLVLAWMIYFAMQPVNLNADTAELTVKPGSMRSVSQQLVQQGILDHAMSFELMVRALGRASEVKAGIYLIKNGVTPYDLMNTLTNGDTSQASITFIEGWTFAQMRAALNASDSVRHMTMSYTERELLDEIGVAEVSAEGLFFPDTYFFSRNASDKEILKRAYQTMQTKLSAAWINRAPGLPYDTPYKALIMASIVEKETGKSSERPQIAGVFMNRLRLGMRLQTDPTVIYGLGDNYDGNLRKKDLLTDSLYNTYTRAGLPPTPIAMPGMGSIDAALNPAKTNAIYFVGKGDGSHAFSATLAEHNRAVAKYQLGKH